jgi:hypothetical protein
LFVGFFPTEGEKKLEKWKISNVRMRPTTADIPLQIMLPSTSFNPIQVFLLSFAESLDNRYKLILALSFGLMI